MAFSFGVEMLNIRARRHRVPVKLRQAQLADLVGDVHVPRQQEPML
jgi:hypothetical protein